MNNKLRVFEAFAGVGSQRMALRNLGIDHEVVGIAEVDKFALKSYEAIHGDCPNFGDISKLDPSELPDMDLFTYSFPCQDLSVAGKQFGLGEGTRSGLLYECEKIIENKTFGPSAYAVFETGNSNTFSGYHRFTGLPVNTRMKTRFTKSNVAHPNQMRVSFEINPETAR